MLDLFITIDGERQPILKTCDVLNNQEVVGATGWITSTVGCEFEVNLRDKRVVQSDEDMLAELMIDGTV